MLSKKLPIVLALLFLSITQAQSYPTFQEYVHQFGKQYNAEEYEDRKGIYEAKIAHFATITDYTPGVNEFTDWTQQELARLSQNHVNPDAGNSVSSHYTASGKVGAASSLNWDNEGVVTSIKHQGSCGSCWAFTAAAYGQSKLILAGQYNNNNIDLSEQYILQCTYNSDCYGGYMEYAMETGLKVPTQSDYPYNPYSSYSGICNKEGVQVGYDKYDYYDLTDNQLIDLLQTGPVAISIASTDWSNYGSGIFSCSSDARVDHAVLLIGYTSDYWIIKNQWGTSWGESGFIRVTRSRSNRANCLVGTSAHIMWQPKIFNIAVLVMFVTVGLLY